ncbi:hypothetical protein FQA39_LY16238 [Lamprigera yunnana]|nr:hypothetical protein FQA39_LY16238 [Lamprigera yunnana]
MQSKMSYLLVLISVTCLVTGHPFLYDTFMSITNMNLSLPHSSYISDLRSAKSEYLSKSMLSDHEHHINNETNNEVTPTVFQKTITKILHKLRFLASLKSSWQDHSNESNVTDASTEIPEDVTELVMSSTNSTEETSARFSLSKVFESVINFVTKMG